MSDDTYVHVHTKNFLVGWCGIIWRLRGLAVAQLTSPHLSVTLHKIGVHY